MFTGIITDLGRVAAIAPAGPGRDLRLTIGAPFDVDALAIGASVACAGCCLTVVARGDGVFAADVSVETLAKTTLAGWAVGDPVNLERALKMGDELGGHLVTGHVDDVAEIVSVVEEAGGTRWRFRAPGRLAPLIAAKGSVALDGVSLTVAGVDGAEFDVAMIPHTRAVTSFGVRGPGDRVNLEVDLLARYVARLQEAAR